MDSSDTLNISTVLGANLLRSRIVSIEGKVFEPAMPLGGILTTETMVKLYESKNSENEWISEVALKISGYPKGTTEELTNQIKPIFLVEIVAQGGYSWEKKPTAKEVGNQHLLHALGRPLYLIAAHEARATAVKLGLVGVRPPADLPREEEESSKKKPKSLPKTKKKPIAKSSDVEDVTEKLPVKVAAKRKSTATKAK
jgi:hypothetical protein